VYIEPEDNGVVAYCALLRLCDNAQAGVHMIVSKPRLAVVKQTRTVTEIALVLLDRDGDVEAVKEIREELSLDDDIQVHAVIEVLSVQRVRDA